MNDDSVVHLPMANSSGSCDMLKVLASLGIALAAGLLAGTTIAHELTPDDHYHVTIGVGTGLLTCMLLLLAFFIPVPEVTMGPFLGLLLVVGGLILVFMSLALQFYVVYRSGQDHSERTQHVSKLLQDGFNRGMTNFNVNLNVAEWQPPRVIFPFVLAAMFIGVCLLAAGVRLALSRNVSWSEMPWRSRPGAGPAEVLTVQPVTEAIRSH